MVEHSEKDPEWIQVRLLTFLCNRTDGRGHNRRVKVTSVKAVDNFWCGI